MEFHHTRRGQTFYEYQVPDLIEKLNKIGTELERANDLKEKELESQKTSRKVE